MKQTVAHLTNEYLPLTQTWLYNQVINLKCYKPIVLAQTVMNLDKFPTQNVYSFSNRNIFMKKINSLNIKFRGYYLSDYFKKILKKNRVKLLHAHFGTEGFRYLKLKKSLNLPMVTAFYGLDVSKVPRKYRWKERYLQLFKDCELFLVEGCNMKNELIKLDCPEDKITIQHLGVDLQKFKFVPRKLTAGGVITVLIAGSFREKKGMPYAIRAFSNVKKIYPNVRLKVIGDGELKYELQNLISELCISDSVDLMGYQPHSVFLNELYNSHIFLSPSITARDGDTEGGAPVSIIEAQATGIPVVSSYHADIPEVVIDGKSAFLAPEKDVETLTAHLITLIEHPETWEKMGIAGRSHVEKNHEIKKQVTKLEKIYSRLLCYDE